MEGENKRPTLSYPCTEHTHHSIQVAPPPSRVLRVLLSPGTGIAAGIAAGLPLRPRRLGRCRSRPWRLPLRANSSQVVASGNRGTLLTAGWSVLSLEGASKMDACGTSKRGRRPTKPQKLKFKPKVPSKKARKSTAQKPQLEETKPIDAKLLKTLRTGSGDAKTLRVIKDEQSAQFSESTVPSTARVSLLPVQSGGQKRAQPKRAHQVPRAFPVAANPERFYGYDDDSDEDEDGNNVELQEPLPSSTECESSIHPAKELNLLEHDDKTRMFLFQLPKSLPLLRTSSTVVQRNGKAIVKEVKEGYSPNDLPGGYMGKMLVYKSGKVKMKLGDALFDVNPGTECGMTQHAVAINTRQKHCCQLGDIEKWHVVVTPDVDSLLKDNRG